MIRPIVDSWQLARHNSQLALHKIFEAQTGTINVLFVAIGKIHWHIKQIIDITFIAKAVFEHEIEHASAVFVSVSPDLRAIAEKAIRLAFGKR